MSSIRAHHAHSALRIVLPAFLLLTLGFTGNAQSTAPASPPQVPVANAGAAPPVIETNVDEVSLDLVVRTKGGKPVTTLQPADLTITDNGIPVKLSEFQLENGASGSNHLVTLVFDHPDYASAKTARELALKIVKTFPDQGYSYAVLQFNGRLRLIQSWTTNHDTLVKGIADATTGKTTGKLTNLTPAEQQIIATTQEDSLSTDYTERRHAQLLLAALTDSQRMMADQHSLPALAALEALARAQRQITGRKVMIYFSRGVESSQDAKDTMRSVANEANRAGVTICAVDTKTMDEDMGNAMMAGAAMAGANPGGALASSAALGAGGYGRGATDTTPIGQQMEAAQNMTGLEFGGSGTAESPLTDLASGTGGIYIRAGGAFRKPLQDLHDQLTNYYEVAYTPNIKDYNGAFRPIVVKAMRKGIVVKTRTGYFALPPENGSGIRPFEVPLLTILAGDKLPTDIAFDTKVMHLGVLPDGNSGDIAIQIPVRQLQARDDATTHLSALHASVVSVVKNDKGAIVERFSDDIGRHEAPDMAKSPEAQYLTMQRHFSAEPGTYTLETAVMDRIGNKAGAQRTTFTIDAQPHGPALSDITLVRTIEPLHEDSSTFEPMRYMNGRVIPQVDNELPENTSNLALFMLIHPLASASREPKLTMRISRNGQLVGTLPLDLGATSGLGAVPYLGTISGHAFPPGDYKIDATLDQGGQTTTSSVAFKVEGTIAASMAPSDEAFAATSGTAVDASGRVVDARLTTSAASSNSHFAITASKDPVPAPTEAEANAIIESTRKRALAWRDSLPNFFCTEITNHSVDSMGDGDWQNKDRLIQMMRYIDHQESRTTIELNGQKSSIQENDLEFAHATGEFGGLFTAVFDPSAKAKFTWQEGDMLDGQPVQVFAYKVELANSGFDVTGENNRQVVVAYHGLVYLDTSTHNIRRVTLEADGIPEYLKVHATSISVDYDWVSINNHDYLMPARGAVSLLEGRHQAVLNDFQFRNYRRFGAQVRILTASESKTVTAKPQ